MLSESSLKCEVVQVCRAACSMHLGGQEFTNILKAMDSVHKQYFRSSARWDSLECKRDWTCAGLKRAAIPKGWRTSAFAFFVPESLGYAFAVFDGGSRRGKIVMGSWLEVVKASTSNVQVSSCLQA